MGGGGQAPLSYPYWVVDGVVYDLTPFIPMHPGGTRWFSRSHGRDISAAVMNYHINPEKVRSILAKYRVEGVSVSDALHPSLNVPKFILPDDFDARVDTPEIRLDEGAHDDALLADVRRVLNFPSMRAKIARADAAFDLIAVIILGVHVFLSLHGVGASWSAGPLASVVVCAGLVLTRTALAAVGHYHCHRAKNGYTDWGDALFDIQYVGASLVLYDGHVLLHHLYTQSHADVKRTVFTAMLHLPRLWRLPVFTLVHLGHLLTGMLIRYVTFTREPEPAQSNWPPLKHASFLAVRVGMIYELVHAVSCGRPLLWLAQFMLTIWINKLMIVASHDFELPSATRAASAHQCPPVPTSAHQCNRARAPRIATRTA